MRLVTFGLGGTKADFLRLGLGSGAQAVIQQPQESSGGAARRYQPYLVVQPPRALPKKTIKPRTRPIVEAPRVERADAFIAPAVNVASVRVSAGIPAAARVRSRVSVVARIAPALSTSTIGTFSAAGAVAAGPTVAVTINVASVGRSSASTGAVVSLAASISVARSGRFSAAGAANAVVRPAMAVATAGQVGAEAATEDITPLLMLLAA